MPIRIAITDDHPLVVSGLQTALQGHPHIVVTAVYTTGADLLNGMASGLPDVLLLDLQLPDASGKDLAVALLKQYPGLRILVLSGLEDAALIREMLQAGCMGYIVKSSTDGQLLLRAIEQVYEGEFFLEESLRRDLLHSIIRQKKEQARTEALLTRREKEVLDLISREYTNQEIADKLSLSVRTIESHRFSLLHKLNVRNTAGLVKAALKMQLG